MILFNRNQLARELTLLSTVLEQKTTNPILAYVKIEASEGKAILTATRLDATMITEMVVEGDTESYCLPLAPLTAAVKLFDGESVKFQREIERDGGRITVSCGRARHRFPFAEVSSFPQPDTVDGEMLILDAPKLLDAIERVLPCVDKFAGRYATQGICFDAADGVLHIIAFNGTESGIVKIATTSAEFQFTVPDLALPALRRVLADTETVSVTTGQNGVLFNAGPRRLITRLLVGRFPPWRMIVPGEQDIKHRINLGREVGAAMKRCCVTASEGNLVRRRLMLEFRRDSITVRSYGGDSESIEEVLIGCETLNGEPLTVKVNADQMIQFLDQVDAPELSIKDAVSILLLREGEHRYLHATLRPDA